MQINSIPIGRGFDWITGAFELFRRNPLIWIVNLVIFLAILMALSLIPLIGTLAAMLLQPVLIGGMLLGCRALERGEDLRIEHLFDGFRQNTNPLVMVGLFSGIAYLLVGLVVLMVVGGALGLSVLGGLADQQALAMGGAISIPYLFPQIVGAVSSFRTPLALRERGWGEGRSYQVLWQSCCFKKICDLTLPSPGGRKFF